MPDVMYYGLLIGFLSLWAVISILHALWRRKQAQQLRKKLDQELLAVQAKEHANAGTAKNDTEPR
jgi:hypothetical protein